jgi:hypothetical protein
MNYYEAPNSVENTENFRGENDNKRLSGFEKGWIITDLVFCSLKLLFIVFGVYAFVNMDPSKAMYSTAVFELALNSSIMVFGLMANIMLLKMKRLGYALGIITLLCVGAFFVLTVFQMRILLASSPDSATSFGILIGSIVVVAIRLGLNIVYFTVLRKVKCKLA